MKNRCIYFLLLINFILFQPVLAQIKPSAHFTEEDGLAGNVVHDIVRDKDGILWIATDNGISKFDGDRFQNIYKTDGLPSNMVWAMAVDENSTIYAGCYHSGLAIIRNDSIIKVLHTKGKYANSFRTLHYSRYYKKLLVGTDYGIYVLQDTTLIPIAYPKDSIAKSSVLSISENNSRIFFSSHSSGLFELFCNPVNIKKSYTSFIANAGRFSCTVLNDTLYSSDYYKIYANPLNDIKKQYTYESVDKKFFIWTMKPYNDSSLLLGGMADGRYKGNLIEYNSKNGKTNLTNYAVGNKSVNGIFYDITSHITWLGTDNGLVGLYDSPFETFESKITEDILDIGFADNSLLVLTKEQVYCFRDNKLLPALSKQQIKTKILAGWNHCLVRFQKKLYKLFEPSSVFELSAFIQDGQKLFVNSTKGAINVPSLQTYYPFGIGTFRTDKNNSIYVNVTYKQLQYFPSIKDSIGYILPRGYKGALSRIFKIMESKGIYYFTSPFYGLSAIKDNKVFYLDETNSKLDNFLTDIDNDANGNIWCTSANGNLFEIGFADSLVVLKELNSSNAGLTGNSCKWLKFNAKFLFIATNKGLNVISLQKLYSSHPEIEYFFDSYNGYDFISAISPVKDSNGNINVHTTDKLIKIDADFHYEPKLNLAIRNAFLNDNKVSIQMIEGQHLPYSTKRISFNFYSAKYPSAKNLKYQYKVNKGDWISGNQVTLELLRADEYKILMETLDLETNLTYSKVFHFSVKNPIWRTWWFILLFTLSLAGIVYIFMRIRIKNLNKNHQEKTSLIIRNSELKLRSLQLQMNPHFIFNALTSVQGFILTQSTEDALIYLGNLASVIRTNLENASEEYILLSKEIEFLRKYAEIEKIRFKENLQVNFISRVDDCNLMLPPMLIQPIIENAIKHGIRNRKGDGIINVDFSSTSEILVITIEDNGVGRAFTNRLNISEHNGVGMNIIKQRLELLNQKHHTHKHQMDILDLIKDGLPAGTKVCIQLLIVRST